MAEVRLTIPDAVVPRVQEAFTATYGWTATLEDGSPNPETKQAFFKRQLLAHIRNVVTSYEVNQAADKARDTARTKAESEVSL